MKILSAAAAAALLLTGLPAQAAGPKLDTDEKKTIYVLGMTLASRVAGLQLSKEEAAVVVQGFSDGLNAVPPKVDPSTYGPGIQAFAEGRLAKASQAEKDEGAAYLEKAASAKGATKTASGMVIQHTSEGSGASPTAKNKVKVHYHGTLRSGEVFDSSVERGTPATFPLGGVIPCWTEGVQQMKVGGKAKLVCPPDLAYGDRGAPPAIQPGATLTFDVELLEIVE